MADCSPRAARALPSESTRPSPQSISRGDLEAAASCFAKDACLITPDATAVRGRAEIRPILHQLIVAGSRIEVQESSIVLAGEVALGSERWLVTSAGSEGEPFTRALTPTMVMRQTRGRLETRGGDAVGTSLIGEPPSRIILSALASAGSRPARIAQLVEHFHGKEGVTSSSLVPGFYQIAAHFTLALPRLETMPR